MNWEKAYFSVPWIPSLPLKGTRIGITGDIVVNENLETLIIKNNFDPFEYLKEWASSLDLLIMTLDATFAGDDPKLWEPRVVTGPDTLGLLPKASVTLINLGNNHAFDMGSNGYIELTRELDRLGISYTGAGKNREEAEQPWRGKVAGLKVAVHSAVHRGTNPRPPLPSGGQVTNLDYDSWWDRVHDSVSAGYATIVLLHGGIQGCQFPSPSAMDISDRLANIGVVLVAWSHAHVVQGGERRSGVPIAYGLGNTYYPPLFGDPAAPNIEDNRYDRGMVLELAISPDKTISGKAMMLRRKGLGLYFDTTRPHHWQKEQERLSRPLRSPFYPLRFRMLRLWEDLILRTWKYLQKDSFWKQIRNIRGSHIRTLFKRLRNVRSDPKDV
jgi:hypothetical protein